MDELVRKIEPLGLSEKEARVYISLLQLGRASAYSVAVKSGLKKPTTYVILDLLIEKGLAIEVPREKKQLYIAKPPEELVTRAEINLYTAKKILPELTALRKNVDIAKARTMYFEGIEGVRQALWYKEKEMRGKEFVGFYASAKDASPELLALFHEWNEHNIKHHTKIRGLTVYDESIEKFRKKYPDTYENTVRFLPKELYTANVSIDVGENFVRIDLIAATQAVIVESKEFADMVKQLFEIVWQSTPTI